MLRSSAPSEKMPTPKKSHVMREIEALMLKDVATLLRAMLDGLPAPYTSIDASR